MPPARQTSPLCRSQPRARDRWRSAAVRTAALALLVLPALIGSCMLRRPEVAFATTTSGPVAGLLLQDAKVFLGLPYAAPPSGPLRWREPEPMPTWTTVRGADRSSPRDPEDCLQVDLFVPRRPRGSVPVLVWIADAAATEPLDGTRLAGVGLAVAVVHTRAGLFGTFAHPALERERPGGPTDFAQLDLAAAMRWLTANAAAFAIDVQHVCLGGREAGAAAAILLLAREPGLALERLLLLQPPAFTALADRRRAIEAGQRILADRRLLPATTATELRALPAEAVAAVTLQDTPLALPLATPAATTPAAALATVIAQSGRPPLQLLVGACESADLLPLAAARTCARTVATTGTAWWFAFRFQEGDAPPQPRDLEAMLFAPPDPPFPDPAMAQRRWLAQIVRDAAANFARGGTPSSPAAPDWPACTAERTPAVVLDRQVAVEQDHRTAELDAATPAQLRR